MSQPQQQQPQPLGQRVVEYTVNLPLAKCVRRLEARHEPGEFWAWDWQYRNWVRVRQQDAATYRFTLRRVQRSMFEFPWAYAAVRGYLRALDGERTVVIAEARISGVALVILSVLMGASFAFALAPVTGLTVFDTRTAVAWVLLATAITGGVLVLMWWWMLHQVRLLFGLLYEALPDWS